MAANDATSAEDTSTTKYKAICIMRVCNVTDLIARKAVISSPAFFCADDPLRTSFNMKLSFGEDTEGKLDIYIKTMSRPVRLLPPCFRINIYDDEMGELISKIGNYESEYTFFGLKNSVFNWGWKDFCSLSFEQEVLRITCDVNYAHELPEVVDPTVGSPSATDHRELSKHMTSLLKYHHDSDFTLNVENKKLNCHKVVLMARSSYFRGLLQSGMMESHSNSVTMTDAPFAAYVALFVFLYTGRLPTNLDKNALDLLPLAEKYAVDELKTACEKIIRSSVTVGNVIQVIVSADLHRSPKLFRHCLPLFKKNMNDLKTTDEWQTVRNDPDLMERLLFACSQEDALDESANLTEITESDKVGYITRLNSDMAKMLDQSSFTDVTLTFENGESMQAHRCILRARSPPLKAALQSHDVKSYKLDGPPAVLKELIRFWYSNAPPENIESIAMDLLPLTKRYEAYSLGVMCDIALRRILSVENLVDILILSELYAGPVLREGSLFRYCFPLYKANALDLKPECKKKLMGHPELLLLLAEGCSL